MELRLEVDRLKVQVEASRLFGMFDWTENPITPVTALPTSLIMCSGTTMPPTTATMGRAAAVPCAWG